MISTGHVISGKSRSYSMQRSDQDRHVASERVTDQDRRRVHDLFEEQRHVGRIILQAVPARNAAGPSVPTKVWRIHVPSRRQITDEQHDALPAQRTAMQQHDWRARRLAFRVVQFDGAGMKGVLGHHVSYLLTDFLPARWGGEAVMPNPFMRALPRLLFMTQAMSRSAERSHFFSMGRPASGLAAAATLQQ